MADEIHHILFDLAATSGHQQISRAANNLSSVNLQMVRQAQQYHVPQVIRSSNLERIVSGIAFFGRRPIRNLTVQRHQHVRLTRVRRITRTTGIQLTPSKLTRPDERMTGAQINVLADQLAPLSRLQHVVEDSRSSMNKIRETAVRAQRGTAAIRQQVAQPIRTTPFRSPAEYDPTRMQTTFDSILGLTPQAAKHSSVIDQRFQRQGFVPVAVDQPSAEWQYQRRSESFDLDQKIKEIILTNRATDLSGGL